jgi:putative transposase
MSKSRFTVGQILDAVKRVEAGIGVPDLCWDVGIQYAHLFQVASEVR